MDLRDKTVIVIDGVKDIGKSLVKRLINKGAIGGKQ